MTDSKKKQRMLYICRRMPHTHLLPTHPRFLFCPFLYRFVRPFFCLHYFVVSHIKTHVGSCSSQFTTKTLWLCVNVFYAKCKWFPHPTPDSHSIRVPLFFIVSSMSPHTHTLLFLLFKVDQKKNKKVYRDIRLLFFFFYTFLFVVVYFFPLPSSLTSLVSCVCVAAVFTHALTI